MKEKFIPADKQNFDRRQRLIILHYTVLDEKDSLITLTRGGVGAHFLIPKQPFKDNEEQFDYYKLVDIKDRAWHAGVSNFAGRSGLNYTSIGIEIVNYGYGLVQDSGEVLFTYQVENKLKGFIAETLKKKDESLYQLLEKEQLLTAFLSDMMRGLVPPPDRETYKEKVAQDLISKYKKLTEKWREENDDFLHIKQEDLYPLEKAGKLVWDEYTDHQIDSMVELITGIEEKLTIKDEKSGKVYYPIAPQFITGHADIAPGRKTDPGPRLWKKLAERGIGAWPDDEQVLTIAQAITIEKGIDYKWIQDNLRFYGYKIDSTGQLDTPTKDVVRVFQMHFEPDNYSGVPSIKTISILEALIKKYYPNKTSDYPRSFSEQNIKKTSSLIINIMKLIKIQVKKIIK
jgi:N-acetyl-anhydromuramyl-L-alanine amidase AmpD